MLSLYKPKIEALDRMVKAALTELHEQRGLLSMVYKDKALDKEDKKTRLDMLKQNVLETQQEVVSLKREKIETVLPVILYMLINKQKVCIDLSGSIKEIHSLEEFLRFLLLESKSYQVYDISFLEDSLSLIYII